MSGETILTIVLATLSPAVTILLANRKSNKEIIEGRVEQAKRFERHNTLLEQYLKDNEALRIAVSEETKSNNKTHKELYKRIDDLSDKVQENVGDIKLLRAEINNLKK